MKKEWKKVKGFSTYECSSDGELKTFNWKNKGVERIMKPAMDNGGYMRTVLKRDSDGKLCTIKVHRVMAITFLEGVEGKNEVNHINGIKHDNRIENLEWCSRSENLIHAYKLGLSNVKGERNPATNLKDSDVLAIRSKFTYGRKGGRPLPGVVSKTMLAKEYNVNVSVIKYILNRKTWKHL